MNENTRTEILDIQVRYGDALEGIARYNREVDLLAANQQRLKREVQAGTITQTDYQRQMAATRVQMREAAEAARLLEREVRQNIAAETAQAGSIAQLRAEVARMTRQYDQMGKAQRESARGQEFLRSLNATRDELNEAVEASQRFQHNVGNYENAILQAAAGNNRFAQTLLGMTAAGQGLGPVLAAVRTGVLAIGRAIVANPIGAIIAAVVVVVTAFARAIRSSEQNLNALNRILAPVRRVLSAMLDVLQSLVGVILRAVEGFGSFVMTLSRMAERLPIVGRLLKEVNDETQRSIDLERDRQTLAQSTRALNEYEARQRLTIARLRTDAEDRENKSVEERLYSVRRAAAIEQEIANQRVENARENLRLLEEEASEAQNNAEVEERLSQARIAVFAAEEQSFNRRRELVSRENSLLAEQQSAANKVAQETQKAGQTAAAALTKQLQQNRDARRAYEDATLRDMAEGAERRRAAARLAADRELEDIRTRLATEKDLTREARASLGSTLEALGRAQAREQAEFEKEIAREAFERTQARERQNLENRLAVLRESSAEALALRLQLLEQDRQAELREAEKTGADRAAINARWDHAIARERRDSAEAAAAELAATERQRWENRLQEARIRSESEVAVQIEARRAELATIARMEEESAEAFLLRRQNLENEITLLQQDRAAEVAQYYQDLLGSAGELFGAFSGFLEEFAEQNEALAVFSKALALFEIGLATGEAIARGIAAAQAVPFPGNLAAIATTIATVVSNIARATQIVNKQQTPTLGRSGAAEAQTQYFADGGLVQGPGTERSDSVPAMLSTGESVLTASATRMFGPMLSAFNQIGGGVPIQASSAAGAPAGQQFLAEAFAEALRNAPAPVVSVEEIERVGARVRVLENAATL